MFFHYKIHQDGQDRSELQFGGALDVKDATTRRESLFQVLDPEIFVSSRNHPSPLK